MLQIKHAVSRVYQEITLWHIIKTGVEQPLSLPNNHLHLTKTKQEQYDNSCGKDKIMHQH
jgi:hypothetical protein